MSFIFNFVTTSAIILIFVNVLSPNTREGRMIFNIIGFSIIIVSWALFLLVFLIRSGMI